MHCLALILIAILPTCKGCFSVTEKGELVDTTVRLTSNMTLKCVYPKNANISQMSWAKKSKGKETIAVFRPPHDFYINRTYKDRVNIVDQTMNDKSLIFNSTTEADTGLYVCSFQSFPHGRWEKKVRVVQTAGNFTPDSAASHVNVEPGRNVTLRCGTDRVITMNPVTWERVQEGAVDTIVQCTQLSLSFHGSDYEERVETDCATQAATIILWNVTEADSGMFRCCYTGLSGETGAHWMKLSVTVSVPLDYKHQLFAIAGGAGVGAAILLLILIVPIVATVVHYRKKKRKRIVMPPTVLLTTQSLPSKSSGLDFHGPLSVGERRTTTVSDTKEEAIYINYPQRQKIQL